MRELGYIDDENIEYFASSPKGSLQLVPSLTSELLNEGVSVIVIVGVTPAQAARKVSSTIPLVLVGGFDPVAAGLAISLARPGYNLTGLSNLADELARKHVELIKEIVPSIRRVGVLAADTDAASRVVDALQIAARHLKVETFVSKVGGPDQVALGVQRFKAASVGAAIVLASPVFTSARQSLVDNAARLRLPVIYSDPRFVDLGGLISYGPDRAVLAYMVAPFVDKILRGANPADLPIQQPTKFEMVINMKAAKDLGVKIPSSVMLRADKVIE
jgi:putative ABC transport system substrate-binding protein